jgi:uncharacterized membrane protein YgaE (UPF0421/DUF939 family)
MFWKKIRFFILIAVGVLVTIFVLFFMPLPFNQSTWEEYRNDDLQPLSVSHRMADGLVLTNRLSNLERSKVESLLGKADNTTYFKEWDMVYRLGMERGMFSIDSEWLVVRLNGEDRVSETKIVRD